LVLVAYFLSPLIDEGAFSPSLNTTVEIPLFETLYGKHFEILVLAAAQNESSRLELPLHRRD
jgi:hypothetical protein